MQKASYLSINDLSNHRNVILSHKISAVAAFVSLSFFIVSSCCYFRVSDIVSVICSVVSSKGCKPFMSGRIGINKYFWDIYICIG